MHRRLSAIIAALSLAAHAAAVAGLTLPHFFSDHMVLQRDKPITIHGMADPGVSVKLSFTGKSVTTTADAAGAWKAKLDPQPADAKGSTLTVTAGAETRTFNDVLVGEVWFASGQSNMALKVTGTKDAATEIAAANHPEIRMFNAKLTPAAKPQADIEGDWLVCSPSNVPSFSAVGYFFALNLQRELGVPVGIINSSWGGKPVETFTSREALASIPEGKRQLDQLDMAIAAYDPEKARQQYEAALKRQKASPEKEKTGPAAKGGKVARKLQPPKNPAATEGRPATLYNGMIHPFVGYTMRGAIWYQGEANSKSPASAAAYGKLFPLMINDWRKRWNDDFTFLWVQLANFKTPSTAPGANDSWAQLQDEQRKTLSLPKTGMAVINDIGDADNIHPTNKQEVGRRLSLLALANVYGKPVIPGGPLYLNSEIKASTVTLHFNNAKGLKTRDAGPLKRFEIAGADKIWHWADAKIEGDTVIVSSPEVPKPAAVRYAWCSNPEGANLVNAEGLPASVFRTDDWPIQ